MTDLLLIFLAAASIENLALIWLFDRPQGVSQRAAIGTALVALFLVLLAALVSFLPTVSFRVPVPAASYLRLLAFVVTAFAIAQSRGGDGPLQVDSRLWRLRAHLPLLVANLAALAFVLFDRRRPHGALETLGFCAIASSGLLLTMALYAGLRDRLEAADLPSGMRGTPIIVATAGLGALAAMGFAGALPW